MNCFLLYDLPSLIRLFDFIFPLMLCHRLPLISRYVAPMLYLGIFAFFFFFLDCQEMSSKFIFQLIHVEFLTYIVN